MHVLKSRFQMYCSSKEEKEKSFPVLKLVLFPLHIHTSTRDFCLTLPVLFCSADPSVAEIWFYSSERFRGYPLTHRASMWFFFFFCCRTQQFSLCHAFSCRLWGLENTWLPNAWRSELANCSSLLGILFFWNSRRRGVCLFNPTSSAIRRTVDFLCFMKNINFIFFCHASQLILLLLGNILR